MINYRPVLSCYVKLTLRVKWKATSAITIYNLATSRGKVKRLRVPRVSLLVKYNAHWSTRIGGGMGYKTPTLFTEQTESIRYQNVAPLDQVRSERSYGGTADVSFRTTMGDFLAVTVNHMFFYTLIDRPLALEIDNANNYHFKNASQPVRSAGFETNARFTYKENFKLFLGYTFTDTRAK